MIPLLKSEVIIQPIGVKSHNRKATIIYIDFRKTFYLIHRGVDIEIIKAYDIPHRLSAIDIMY